MAGPEPLTQQGAIPSGSGQQDTANAGIQITALLGQRAALDSQITQALPSALNPVKTTGVASPTLPGSFKFGVGQPNLPAPQGHRDAVRQGVAKTVAGVGNIVGQILTQKQNEKTRMLATDIHRVLEAQDAISQATTQLKGDPNNKDAQAVIDKNKQIINDTIGADPKKLKQFEKAFSMNPLKPEENTDPEHKALQSATKTFADRLMQQTPDKLGPNTAAINKVQVMQQQAATMDAQIKSLMPAYVQQERDIAAKARVDEQQAGSLGRAVLHEGEADKRANLNADIKTQQMQVAKDIAKLRSSTQYGVEARREAAAMERTNAMIEGRQTVAEKLRAKGNTAAADKIDEQVAALYEKEVDKLTVRINNMIQTRDNDVKSGASDKEVNNWNDRINTAKSQQDLYQKMLGQYAKENMNLPPEEKGGPSASVSKSVPATSIGPNDDSEDDDRATDPDSDYYK